MPLPDQLPSRVIVEVVRPEVDGGRFPVKRTAGEDVAVTADVHADGHDVLAAALHPALAEVMARHADRSAGSAYDRVLAVTVDPERARFGTWYELFPRSCADEPGRHGTFRDVERRLPYVAGMGFDVLYLPPVHPIGRALRKGPNNTLTPGPNDPGSPWAIGGPEGGHKDVLPDLGTLADFDRLVA